MVKFTADALRRIMDDKHNIHNGKDFFRQARSRLSCEQFSAFLANIKKLNARQQSEEETLRKAEEIFGRDNIDLCISFKGLLTSNTPDLLQLL